MSKVDSQGIAKRWSKKPTLLSCSPESTFDTATQCADTTANPLLQKYDCWNPATLAAQTDSGCASDTFYSSWSVDQRFSPYFNADCDTFHDTSSTTGGYVRAFVALLLEDGTHVHSVQVNRRPGGILKILQVFTGNFSNAFDNNNAELSGNWTNDLSSFDQCGGPLNTNEISTTHAFTFVCGGSSISKWVIVTTSQSKQDSPNRHVEFASVNVVGY